MVLRCVQNDSPPPPDPFDASLIFLLISEISWIQLCRSLCSIIRMSSRDQWKWYAIYATSPAIFSNG